MKAQLGINQILITLKLKTLKTEKSIKVVIIKSIKNPYNHHFKFKTGKSIKVVIVKNIKNSYNHHFKIVVQAKGNRMNY